MSGTIYGLAVSPNIQNVVVVAKYLNQLHGKEVVNLKLKVVSIFDGSNHTPEYLTRNPFGQIPAYESDDHGVKLFESRAIARYIDAKEGGKLLHLSNPAEYGLVETWISVEASSFYKYAYPLVAELVFKKLSGGQPDQAEAARLKEALFKVLDVYEKELAKKKDGEKYLAGNSLSLADLLHLPNLTYLVPVVPDLFAERKNVEAWYKNISELQAWKDTLKEAHSK